MIYEMLSQGEENARTGKELAAASNLEVREVMDVIRNERLAGQLICSSSKGFFIAKEEADIKRTVSRLYKQARGTRAVAEAMRKAWENIYGTKDEKQI